MDRLKVLLLTHHMPIGGIEMCLLTLTRHLVRRGHEVLLAARPGSLSPLIAKEGGRFVPLEVRMGNPFALVRDVRRLCRIIREEQPDIVHVFAPSSGFLVQLANAFTLHRQDGSTRPIQLASVMGIQNSPHEARIRIQARMWLNTWGAQRILLPSPSIERVVRSLRIRSERFARQVVQGVEISTDIVPTPEDLDGIRRELKVPSKEPLVVTIGRLNASKSHELFIRAAAEALKHRTNIHFLIVGGGELHNDLQVEIDRLAVGTNVRILGERQDVSRILRAVDIYVRPGIVEGFVGMTVLEAQAIGVPVIAFETEDVKMAIEHERTGLLVPPGDVPALADAVERLLDDRELANRIGAAGRAHVESTFAIGQIVEELERRYVAELEKARLG